VEASGEALLRTICKLTHIGPKQYAKGSTRYFHWPYFIFVSVALRVLPLLLSRSLFFSLVPTTIFPSLTAPLTGDGIAFRDFLLDKFPNLKNGCVGRAELSKR
jgi:hypothetical protein